MNCRHLRINIINDEINEAEKQVFIMKLTLDGSRNPDLITLSQNVSLGIIIDDDRKLLTIYESYTKFKNRYSYLHNFLYL